MYFLMRGDALVCVVRKEKCSATESADGGKQCSVA
jgi:hypothetical protein